jgi:hypothetical protein
MDTHTSTHHDAMATSQPADDGRRYTLAGPGGTTTVHGSADLARRVGEANRLGECVAWQQLDDTADATTGADEADRWVTSDA